MQNNISDLVKFVTDFGPNYHLTLQWDLNHRTRTIPVLEKRLYYFMSRAQREAFGRNWHRYHIPFIGFGETNSSGEYHLHILLKDSTLSRMDWKKIFDKVASRSKKTPIPKNPYLQEITRGAEWKVAKYDTKQLNANNIGNTYANSVIITSEYLFSRKKRGEQWKNRIL